MFKNLFSKKNQENDEFFVPVDPVVERRRQEKFSAPLIYDEEFNQPTIDEKPKATTKKTEVEKVAEPISYRMSEVISPMFGSTNAKKETKSHDKRTISKVKRKTNNQLIPVISPFYGEPEGDLEEPVVEVDTNDEIATLQVEKPKETVEDNLRNIAKIIEEEKDQLRIIEERTGEFKLDFSNVDGDQPQKVSLIDEIEDDMSLDELMSLYEKKFTD